MTRHKNDKYGFSWIEYVFGYAIDKGWMCVQVFFVRQGKLIERDVSMFPFDNETQEDFLTYIGQFYQENEHFIPKKS